MSDYKTYLSKYWSIQLDEFRAFLEEYDQVPKMHQVFEEVIF